MVNIIQKDNSIMSNIYDSETVDNFKYFVHLVYPYPVINEHNLQYRDYSSDTHMGFSRRLSAERFSLLRLVSYHESNGNIERAIYFRNLEHKLEEEHPEWLI